MNSRELIIRYWETLNARDWAGFAETLAEDLVYEVPQTRERVRGKEHYLEFNQTYPGDWTIEIVRVVADASMADESQAAGQILFRDGDQTLTGISFFRLRNGKIQHITDFWPEPYEPPERMSRGVERY